MFQNLTNRQEYSNWQCKQMETWCNTHTLELKVEHAYWASNTYGQGNNVSLCLDDDGHLYLLNSTGKYLSNLTQGGYPTNGIVRLMRIDADGIFRLYSHNLEKNGN